MIAPGVALLQACHPGPTLAVSTVAALLSTAVGNGVGGTTLVTAAVLTGQLSIGWINDWLDRDRDRQSARTDKPLVVGTIRAQVVGRAAAVAVVCCIGLSLATGLRPGALHLIAVASAWAYNLGLKATMVSVLPYLLSFGLLPAFIVAAAPGPGSAPIWMVTAGALLGAGAHFANVIPDLDDDAATGVRGLGHRLGRTACGALAAVLLLASVVLLAAGPPGGITPVGVLVMAGAVVVGAVGLIAGRRPGSRAPFVAVLVIAVAAVALLVGSGTRLH